MMAPDYAHWHGMYEVADRFYMQLIPQAREIAHQAEEAGQTAEAEAVRKVIEDLLARPEHKWYEEMKVTRKAAAADQASVTSPENSESAVASVPAAEEVSTESKASPAAPESKEPEPVIEPGSKAPADQK